MVTTFDVASEAEEGLQLTFGISVRLGTGSSVLAEGLGDSCSATSRNADHGAVLVDRGNQQGSSDAAQEGHGSSEPWTGAARGADSNPILDRCKHACLSGRLFASRLFHFQPTLSEEHFDGGRGRRSDYNLFVSIKPMGFAGPALNRMR